MQKIKSKTKTLACFIGITVLITLLINIVFAAPPGSPGSEQIPAIHDAGSTSSSTSSQPPEVSDSKSKPTTDSKPQTVLTLSQGPPTSSSTSPQSEPATKSELLTMVYYIKDNKILASKRNELSTDINPLTEEVKNWIDTNKNQGIYIDGENLVSTSIEQSTLYKSSWFSKHDDRQRVTTVTNKINKAGGNNEVTIKRETKELDENGQTNSLTITEEKQELTPDKTIIFDSYTETENGRNTYSKREYYSGKGTTVSVEITAEGKQFVVNKDNDKVLINGEEKTISEARELLKNNYNTRTALGDAYVETAKGTWWWPKSINALDFTRLLGITLRSADQFKGLSAVNSLIKDKEYQKFLEQWQDGVRRNFPILNPEKYLATKVFCESPIKKMKQHQVVGEFGEKPKGLVRVSAEKSNPINTPVGQNYQYVITYHIENPHNQAMNFNVLLKNNKEKIPVYTDSAGNALNKIIQPSQKETRTKRDPIITDSSVKFSNYQQICITFNPEIQVYGSSKKTGEWCDTITGYQGKEETVQKAEQEQKQQPKTGETAQLNKGFI